MKIQISPKAYTKLLLHAAKYPHKAVNGLLLGEDALQDHEVYALDAVPLFHQSLGLAPMLEVALNQVDSYCKASGLQIVGYFQANEHLDNNSPNGIAYKISEKITDHFNHGFLLMIDNTKLSMGCDEVAIKCYAVQDNKWKLIDNDLVVVGGDDTLNLTSDLIEGKAYQSLVDFDNHLDDISLDWLNHDINRLVDLTG